MTERMTQETCDLVDVAHVFTSDQIKEYEGKAVHLESGRSEKICRELSEILVSEILSENLIIPTPLMQASHIHEILAAKIQLFLRGEGLLPTVADTTDEPYLGYDDSDTSRLRKKLDLLPHEFSILAEYVVNTIIEKSLVEYDDGIFIWDGESLENLVRPKGPKEKGEV